MKYILPALLLLTSHLPLYLMDDENIPLIDQTVKNRPHIISETPVQTQPQQPMPGKPYGTHIFGGVMLGIPASMLVSSILVFTCVNTCAHTVFGSRGPLKTPEEAQHMVDILFFGSIAVCTSAGALIGAGIAKWCPCKK